MESAFLGDQLPPGTPAMVGNSSSRSAVAHDQESIDQQRMGAQFVKVHRWPPIEATIVGHFDQHQSIICQSSNSQCFPSWTNNFPPFADGSLGPVAPHGHPMVRLIIHETFQLVTIASDHSRFCLITINYQCQWAKPTGGLQGKKEVSTIVSVNYSSTTAVALMIQ